jgi:DNA-directed RNA polymerase specialized sigma24 family protein
MTSTARTGIAPGEGDLEAAIDRTLGTAFGLALRITADRDAAEAACEAAYVEGLVPSSGTPVLSAGDELAFLGRVRSHALRLRPAAGRSAGATRPYPFAMAARECLESADPLARRAIELCYFGGLSAGEAAAVLEAPVEDVRRAMREALLAIGAAAGEASGEKA